MMIRPNQENLVTFLQTCQIPSGRDAGGIRDGYHIKSEQYDFIYSETTGYAATFFANLARVTGELKYLDQARLAGDYLISHMIENRLPYHYSTTGDKPDHRFFVFDNAICIQGFVDLFHATQDQRYHDAARKLGAWMMSMYQDRDVFLSYEDATDGSREHPGKNFSDDGGVLHLKNSIALLKLATLDSQEATIASARAILDEGMKRQTEAGGFPIHFGEATIFSHAHCYATEGYLYAYLTLHDSHYLSTAKKAGDYLLTAQGKNGGIFQFNRSAQQAADATAQAIRIWKTLDLISEKNNYQLPIERGLTFLAHMQVTDGSGEGAILYTRGRLGLRTPIGFTWVSMFSGSALNLVDADQILPEEIY